MVLVVMVQVVMVAFVVGWVVRGVVVLCCCGDGDCVDGGGEGDGNGHEG